RILSGDGGVVASSHGQPPAMSCQGSSIVVLRLTTTREREAGVKPISAAALSMIWACRFTIARKGDCIGTPVLGALINIPVRASFSLASWYRSKAMSRAVATTVLYQCGAAGMT